MTLTIRSLVLMTGCYLATACSDPAGTVQVDGTKSAKEATKKSVEQVVEKTAEPIMPTVLTTTSPARPDSVADAPVTTAITKEVATLDRADEALMFEHEEYDRPLEPSEVEVTRFVLASGVEGREPVGESDAFREDTKEIFAFVQLANENGLPYAFKVHFEPLDGPATPYGVQLSVPTAPRFRTWSWTRIKRSPGHYKAVLRTLDGKDIAQREFEIVAAPTAELDTK